MKKESESIMLNFKVALKALFGGQNVIVITEDNEKLGGKLICRQNGTFAIRKLSGVEIPIWPSSMRLIGLDGFEVAECKGADGSSKILLENGLPQQVRDNLSNIEVELPVKLDGLLDNKSELNNIREKLYQLGKPIQNEINKVNEALQSIWQAEQRREVEERIRANNAYRQKCGFRIGDPFDIEDITVAKIFNKGRSGPNRQFRKDPYEEFALVKQESGAIGLLSDFWTVYRVA